MVDGGTVIDALRDRLDAPTSRDLATAVGRAIRDGVLVEGQRLPAIRAVAGALELAPTTVSAAWAVLVRAGSLHTDGRRGTTVATAPPGPNRYRLALEVRGLFSLDLSTGVPDPAMLPDLGPALRSLQRTGGPGSYLDEPAVPELLDVLRVDWPYPAERLVVTDGAMDAMAQVVAAHVRFGDVVAIEHPGFPPLMDLLESAGACLLPVGLDDDGPRPSDLAAAVTAGARHLVVQTRAQNPTGIAITPERAERLAALLRGHDVLVIEDDSAGAVSCSPAVSLGSALPDRTLHVRSFSKSHGPDLRLAALSGPAALIEPIVERRFLGQGWTSRLLQRLLLYLLTDPVATAAVAHARDTYAARRGAVVAALRAHGVQVAGHDGINLWLPVRDETAAMVRLASRGIGVAAGTPFASRAGDPPHVRVTTAALADDHDHIGTELAAAAGAAPPSGPR